VIKWTVFESLKLHYWFMKAYIHVSTVLLVLLVLLVSQSNIIDTKLGFTRHNMRRTLFIFVLFPSPCPCCHRRCSILCVSLFLYIIYCNCEHFNTDYC